MHSSYNMYIVGGVIILLLGASIVFRDRISSLLGGLDAPVAEQSSNAGPSPSSATPEPPSSSQGQAQTERIPENHREVPKYTGRDPGEIRPNEKEIKGFTDTQRQNLYDEIRNQAANVKENPDLYSSWMQIGVYKKTIGDYAGARDAWEYAALLYPEQFVPHYNLGQLYWHNIPDYVRAEAKLKIAIKLHSTDASAYLALSDLYLYSYKQKSNSADDILLDGLKKIPNDINLLKSLAYVYGQRGEDASALETWRKILAINPNDQSVKNEIAELEGKLGKK